MTKFSIPDDAAPNGYIPNPYESELDAAYAFIKAAGDSEDGWDALGTTKEGVKKEVQRVPGEPPLTRGTGTIEGFTPIDLLPIVTHSGARKHWDQRFSDSGPLERYSRRAFMFYGVQKGAMLIQPRDSVGVQNTYEEEDGTIFVIQCSIPNPPSVPDFPGKTRAWIIASGWRLRPLSDGNGTEVCQMIKVNPRISLPPTAGKAVIQEIFQSVVKVIQWVQAEGLIPYVLTSSIQSSLRFETYEHKDRAYSLGLLAASSGGEVIELKVDEDMKYSGGYEVIVGGEGKDAVTVEKLVGKGILKLSVQAEAAGRKFDLTIKPLKKRS